LTTILYIAIGGALGSVCRYGLSTSLYRCFGQAFPFGTLAVNVIGSFLMGALSVLIIERFNHIDSALRSLLLIGFLGGFTTFSAFSLETLNLAINGAQRSAILNIILSLSLCLIAVWLGVLLGRRL